MYFFDTYAFFELTEGNADYAKYVPLEAITTIFNLAEFNFALKRETIKDADKTTKLYEPLLVDVVIEDIFNAMDLRIKNRKLSVPDAIGYTVAKRCNAKFLTGDKEFKGMPNVEFMK